MNSNTFDAIWNVTIQIATQLIQRIDKKVAAQIDLCIVDSKKEMILKQYDKCRNELKEKYYQGVYKNGLICHHKIASCYCSALIQHKIVRYDCMKIDLKYLAFLSEDKLKSGIKTKQENIPFLNYKIAFLAGLSIVYLYLLEYYETSEQLTENEREFAVKILIERGNLEYPAVNDTHDDFLDGVVKMIGIRDLNNDEFDTLGFSYIYYFIEEYNKTIIRKNYLEQLS
ncbi:hypothetical protein [Anaeromicropila populeti]|uniref:Uncharacterized protein n=1 Tax=Anaeromicropila populeti TaxID=37658 RepID=A0A1I6LBU3_9FIRM|nr:hypothetical protein [Anaeromicropila populeti]SFS00952.1 hypothetical protein SAMN05661086_03197 [Anaeromicropila populeti]